MRVGHRATFDVAPAVPSPLRVWLWAVFPGHRGCDDLPLRLRLEGAVSAAEPAGASRCNGRRGTPDRAAGTLVDASSARPCAVGSQTSRHGSDVDRAFVPDESDRPAAACFPRHRSHADAAGGTSGNRDGTLRRDALWQVRARAAPVRRVAALCARAQAPRAGGARRVATPRRSAPSLERAGERRQDSAREYASGMAFRIVVLGGYGNFGGRICRSLATDKEIWLGVAGRDLTRD